MLMHLIGSEANIFGFNFNKKKNSKTKRNICSHFRLFDYLIDWLIGWLVGWLADRF